MTLSAPSGLLSTLLLPLAWLYGAAVFLRNAAFDLGLFRETAPGVPVISVGNLTAGGTGKTPVVEHLLSTCLARGMKVAVISRGYGRATRGVRTVSSGSGPVIDAREGGDEPVQIARNFPETIVVVGERKAEAARRAVEEFGAEVVIVDDGFQHRSLRRTADIVVVDTRHNLFRERLLPAGLRREPLSALRRADLLILSKVDPRTPSEPWVQALRRFTDKPMVWSSTVRAGAVRASDGVPADPEAIAGTPVFGFSGIADHAAFIRDVRAAGFTVAGDRRFPDHHVYTEKDASGIEEEARSVAATLFVTTEKDLVRLVARPEVKKRLVDPGALMVMRVRVQIVKGAEHLAALLDNTLGNTEC